jgi:ribosomal protein S18 acetylase RimI-like enzyme
MHQLRKLIPGDHELIGDILADSFSDDPVNRWVLDGHRAMRPFYTQVAKKHYLRQGFGHVTDDATGGTLWLPPDVKKEIPLWNSLDIAFSMIRNSGLKSIARGMAFEKFLADKKPKQPHYFLFVIGTRPSHQGKGVGGTLMRAGLESVDADNMPAYLESSKESNLPFYRKFGFEVIEKGSSD